MDGPALWTWGEHPTNGTHNGTDLNCIGWVNDSLAECVQNWWGVMSVFIGYSSIGFWLFAQAPQLYLNFKNQNADSLALPFLIAWLFGDSTNLLGSILAQQLGTQIYTSAYFCTIDVVLFTQWLNYSICRKSGRGRKGKRSRSKSLPQKAEQSASHVVLPAVAMLAMGGGLALYSTQAGQPSDEHLGRVLYAADEPGMIVRGRDIDPNAGYPFVQGSLHTTGYAFGILSAAFYLVSRIPQIVKNYRRRSTGGLSFVMFLMAILGNTTYALSVLLAAWQPYLYDSQTPPNRISTSAFMVDKLPWLVGSVGTLVFDMTIFFQFWYYGDKRLSIREDSGCSMASEEDALLGGQETTITPPDSDDDSSDEDKSTRPPLGGKLLESPLFFPASQRSSSYQCLASSKLR